MKSHNTFTIISNFVFILVYHGFGFGCIYSLKICSYEAQIIFTFYIVFLQKMLNSLKCGL